MKAIILAGGSGTRLRPLVSDRPKPMAIINGRPFLSYILEYLEKFDIKEVILCVGYQKEQIINFFGDKWKNISISYSIENNPLGTGGAIKKVLNSTTDEFVFVLNGDTFFDINLNELIQEKTEICFALKELNDFDRYGTVEIDFSGRILEFKEKRKTKKGKINGGVYFLSTAIFKKHKVAEDKFSFEKFLEENISEIENTSIVFENYFIDIGIPEDYKRAQVDFSR